MSKASTPEEQAKKAERSLFLHNLTNRQRLANAYYTNLHYAGKRLVHWRDDWWGWADTHYVKIDSDSLESALSRFIESEFNKAGNCPPNLTRGVVSDVLGIFQARANADSLQDAPFSLVYGNSAPLQRISLANGVLDVETAVEGGDALAPHDPEWFSLAALPFAYDPAATCPKWDEFLTETFEGDAERVAFVEEWLGYCCTYDYSYQYAVILLGEGANGKGVLTKLAVALVGEENCSHVPLEMFGKQFQLVPTIGKLLNTAPEMSSLDRRDEEQLKAVTGSDRLTLDVKYGAALSTKLTAKLMFSTNELPIFQDKSGGLKRRLIVVPFNRVVPEEARNTKLPTQLMSELPGIFNRCLSGLRRLRQRGDFAIPLISRMTLERHMLDSEPAKTFLEEFTKADKLVASSSMDLYKGYVGWFLDQGFPLMRKLSQPAFAKEVERLYGSGAERFRDAGERARYYVGVRSIGVDGIRMLTV